MIWLVGLVVAVGLGSFIWVSRRRREVGTKGYRLDREDGQASITCLSCDMTSYHPSDIAYLFCGHCHRFHTRST